MRTLVVSGINLVDGGALSVFYDFLDALIECEYYKEYKVIAMVSSKKLFEKYNDYIELIEFPKSKKSWIYRLYYEYIFFKKFSSKRNIDIWISLHDITPNVKAKKRYVYCHNPSPFNHMKLTEIKYGLKYYLFSKFYKYLYRINIKKNTAVIVQQEWLRNEFKKFFKINNIIVARPSISNLRKIEKKIDNGQKVTFIYPSYPRYYKNFEVLCKAVEYINDRNIKNFEVILTVDGSENKYSNDLIKKYKNVSNINFMGLLSRERLYSIYSDADCLIFMSKLETWGMPIIEFMETQRTMLISDLPYAYETVGNYNDVSFINVDDYQLLAKEMINIIQKKHVQKKNIALPITQPYAKNWNELLKMLLKIEDNLD